MPLDAAGHEPGSPDYSGPAHHSSPSADGKSPAKLSGLGKKVGPLPLWGWGVIGAAVLGFFVLRARASSTTSASSPTGSTANVGGIPTGGAMTPLDTSLNDLVNAQQAVIQSLQSQAASVPSVQTDAVTGNPVSNLYGNLLGRTPDTSGATFFGNELGKNPTSNNVLQAFQQIASSPEGQQYAAQNPSAFWTGAYREVLNREPDAAGVQYWQHLAQTTSVQNATAQFSTAAKNEEGLK